MSSLPRLSRAHASRPPAPIRLVHFGLGNFFRAHQAFFTDAAPDAGAWGYAAFTGRRAEMAEKLAPQDGLYTLIVKHAEGDEFKLIESLSAVHPASDYAALLGYFRDPQVAVITTTITEAGYRRNAAGGLDTQAEDIAAEIRALQADRLAPVGVVPLRIAAGLAERAATHPEGAPITLLPCDNLPGNGAALRRVVEDALALVAPEAGEWVAANVAWATSMVDRITPATTEAEIEAVARECGYADASPVGTEPFCEWVISGDFPAGRPAWEAAGAVICPDVEPFEQRKLWMLNGSHSLLAYAGSIRGFETVKDAIADPQLREWVWDWWKLAGPHLQVEWEEYARALEERFANPNIRHLLAQIAHDGSQKIPVRILPVLRAELQDGKTPLAALRVVAAWLAHLRGYGAEIVDAEGDTPRRAANSSDNWEVSARALYGVLDPALAGNKELVSLTAKTAIDLIS